jgi:hypothetical protein
MAERRARNDLRQYDDLAAEWWRPDGAFAALHWLARARGELVPPPSRPDAALLDLGCGRGLLAPRPRFVRQPPSDAEAACEVWAIARTCLRSVSLQRSAR